MLLPNSTEAYRLAFEPREKSDTVLRGCTALCVLGDANLAAKTHQLERLRGAFTHLLVLADVPVSDYGLSGAGTHLWSDKWPTGYGVTRDRASLSALAVRNIELLGGMGFELHLALFNADAAEGGMAAFLGSRGGTDVGFSPSVDYVRQLPHELKFVQHLIAQPCVKHITGILPCFGGSDASAGDFALRLVDEIKACGYTGSILQNLGGEARTLFGPKFLRAGVLSVCNIANAGEWVRTACDIRSAIGLTVPPNQTTSAVRMLCDSPGAVGYYMDFGAHVGAALPDSVLVAAGAVAAKVVEAAPIQEAAVAAAVAQGGPSDAATPLWKPLPGSTTALLRLPDVDTGLPVPVENIPCVLSSRGTTTPPMRVHREVYKGVPVVAYVFDVRHVTGPARLSVVRSDSSMFTFDISDVSKREYLRPTVRLALNIFPQAQGAVPAEERPAQPTAVPAPEPLPLSPPVDHECLCEELDAGRLSIPTSWYTRRPLTVSYVYSINGAKRFSLPAKEVAPGVYELGTAINKTSHPVGTQPNVWILKFEPQTVVDGSAMVHEMGNYWYVYIENGKPRDR